MKKKVYFKNGLYLFLTCLVLQSCTAYSVLPKNMSNRSAIEGIYSNKSEAGDMQRSFWGLVENNYKREIKKDRISVKVEIVNPKLLKFSFLENNVIIGTKQLKGKFQEDECFYTRRSFIVIPLIPIVFGWANFQERIYRVEEALIIEITGNHGGVAFFFASGDKYNDIWRFKQIED